jgi:hypothetical protein
MAIRYQCDNCGDIAPGYYSESRQQWEAPEGWVCFDKIRRVEDEDKGHYRHFCGTSCLVAFIEVQVDQEGEDL